MEDERYEVHKPLRLVRLGRVQKDELAHGWDITSADYGEEHADEMWHAPTSTTRCVTHFLYRVTSTRDIAADNAAEGYDVAENSKVATSMRSVEKQAVKLAQEAGISLASIAHWLEA